MIRELIEKMSSGNDLTNSESFEVMNRIMNGELNNSQIASLITALKVKGETATELAGFVKAMRLNGIKINSNNSVDVCGTGGDSSGTFNISTAVSFVVAGAGIKVAKHGNKSISSKCGSSDVLNELGVKIDMTPTQSEEALNEIGIAFLFAPIYHPAMKYAAPVRSDLGIRTIFNILGPLSNPASTKKQLIGTYSIRTAELMAKACEELEMEKISFVCTNNKFDEISLTGETEVIEYDKLSGIRRYNLNHESFNYPIVNAKNIEGNTPVENAEIINSLFTKEEKNDAFYVTAANAALALYTAGYSSNLEECTYASEESILNGKAYQKLKQLRAIGEKYS